ncbi:MAG: DUF1801 domain-containing protein [Planctomycetes bacterium]|nr:DUF1801 domain-containing protein [Planctomycetota bacterium]
MSKFKARPGQGVDDFLKRFPRDIGPVVRNAAALIRKHVKADEAIKWGWPCWTGNKMICAIMAARDHVNMVFHYGAKLNDPKKLLEGTGKGMRHIKLYKVADVKKPGIPDLLKAAVTQDANA